MSAVDALQRTLAAEHAAVWTYGLLGGRTSASADPQLYAAVSEAFATHRTRRDELTDRLVALREEPVAAAASYAEPGPVLTAAQVTRAAADVEAACSQTYAAQVAETVGDQRRWAVTALAESAVTELTFGGDRSDFPGAPDLA